MIDKEDKLRLEEYADAMIDKTAEGKRKIALNAPRKYAVYLRKSTKGKKRQARSIKDQKKSCLRLVKRKKLKIRDEDIFTDRFSAKKPNKRTEFSRMIDLIEKGKYNAIIAWHPDRLSRNMKEGGAIIDLIDQAKIIDLKFPTYVFNNDSNGIMSLGIQFVIAKQYSDNLATNSSRGSLSLVEEGKMSNKNKYGYKTNESRFPIPDGDNFDTLKTAFKMSLENTPFKQISIWINSQNFSYVVNVKGKERRKDIKMTPQILSTILSDPFYCGLHIYGTHKVWMQNTNYRFEPMITVDDFLLLRYKISKGKAFDRKRDTELLFQKMVTCGYCNNGMTPYVSSDKKGTQDRNLYIRCSNASCETRLERGTRGVKSNTQFRGKVIFEYIYNFLNTGITVTREVFNEYQEAGKAVLVEKKKDLILEIKRESQNIVKLDQDSQDYTKSLAKADPDNLESINAEIRALRENIKEKESYVKNLKSELEETKDLIGSQTGDFETFSNFFKNLLPIIKNSDDRLLLDKIIKMVFSNFVIKDKKVTNHTLNPEFEKRFKHLLIPHCGQ